MNIYEGLGKIFNRSTIPPLVAGSFFVYSMQSFGMGSYDDGLVSLGISASILVTDTIIKVRQEKRRQFPFLLIQMLGNSMLQRQMENQLENMRMIHIRKILMKTLRQ